MTSQIAGVDVLRILAKEILSMGDIIIWNDPENSMNTVLGYKKGLKVTEDMIHID